MTVSMRSLGIDQLPIEARLELVHEIWDSIAAEKKHTLLSDAQIRELRKRSAEHDASPDDVVPWEQVKAEALARLGK